jgi:hypothetical protein
MAEGTDARAFGAQSTEKSLVKLRTHAGKAIRIRLIAAPQAGPCRSALLHGEPQVLAIQETGPVWGKPCGASDDIFPPKQDQMASNALADAARLPVKCRHSAEAGSGPGVHQKRVCIYRLNVHMA